MIKVYNFSQGIYFKIEKVRVKTEKEIFYAKKTLEDSTGDERLSKIFLISKSEQSGAAAKRHADSIEHLYRRDRKIARPRLLSGR